MAGAVQHAVGVTDLLGELLGCELVAGAVVPASVVRGWQGLHWIEL
jgi:hypothetical protein